MEGGTKPEKLKKRRRPQKNLRLNRPPDQFDRGSIHLLNKSAWLAWIHKLAVFRLKKRFVAMEPSEAVRAPTTGSTFAAVPPKPTRSIGNGFKRPRVLKTLGVRSDERQVGANGSSVFFGESQWQQETEDGAANVPVQRTAPFLGAIFLMVFRVPASGVGAAAVRAVSETQVVIRKEVAL